MENYGSQAARADMPHSAKHPDYAGEVQSPTTGAANVVGSLRNEIDTLEMVVERFGSRLELALRPSQPRTAAPVEVSARSDHDSELTQQLNGLGVRLQYIIANVRELADRIDL